jgi:hypothetical protein
MAASSKRGSPGYNPVIPLLEGRLVSTSGKTSLKAAKLILNQERVGNETLTPLYKREL